MLWVKPRSTPRYSSAASEVYKGQGPAIVEMCAYAGFDLLIIDNEHGSADLQMTEHLLRAARASGIPALVRCLEHDIPRVLDMGASGLQIPMVESAVTGPARAPRGSSPRRGWRGACRGRAGGARAGVDHTMHAPRLREGWRAPGQDHLAQLRDGARQEGRRRRRRRGRGSTRGWGRDRGGDSGGGRAGVTSGTGCRAGFGHLRRRRIGGGAGQAQSWCRRPGASARTGTPPPNRTSRPPSGSESATTARKRLLGGPRAPA